MSVPAWSCKAARMRSMRAAGHRPARRRYGGPGRVSASNPGRMIALPDHGDLTEWVMCQPSGTVLYSCQRMGSVLGKSV